VIAEAFLVAWVAVHVAATAWLYSEVIQSDREFEAELRRYSNPAEPRAANDDLTDAVFPTRFLELIA
jgi:hypothetical protein